MPSSIRFPTTGRLRVELRLEGEWVTLDRLSNNLAPAIKEAYDRVTLRASKELLGMLRSYIGHRRSPPGVNWRPLSSTSRKPDQFYYVSGLFNRVLGIRRSSRGTTYIGVPSKSIRTSTSRSGLTLPMLLSILENGTEDYPSKGAIPPRPLFAPTYLAFGGNKEMKKRLVVGIRKSLMAKTGLKANQIKVRL